VRKEISEVCFANVKTKQGLLLFIKTEDC